MTCVTAFWAFAGQKITYQLELQVVAWPKVRQRLRCHRSLDLLLLELLHGQQHGCHRRLCLHLRAGDLPSDTLGAVV